MLRPITTALTRADPCVRSWRELPAQAGSPTSPWGGTGCGAFIRRAEEWLPRIIPTTLPLTDRRLLA